jgi:hypothetical protein
LLLVYATATTGSAFAGHAPERDPPADHRFAPYRGLARPPRPGGGRLGLLVPPKPGTRAERAWSGRLACVLLCWWPLAGCRPPAVVCLQPAPKPSSGGLSDEARALLSTLLLARCWFPATTTASPSTTPLGAGIGAAVGARCYRHRKGGGDPAGANIGRASARVESWINRRRSWPGSRHAVER